MKRHASKNTAPGKATGIKPTAREIEKRVDECVDLLTGGRRKHEIVDRFHRRYGVGWRTTARYLARARGEMLNRLQKPREEFRAESLSFYESLIAAKASTIREKLLARQQIDELLGLNAPRRTEMSGPEGKPIPVEKPPFDFAAYRKVWEEVFGQMSTDQLRQGIARLEAHQRDGKGEQRG